MRSLRPASAVLAGAMAFVAVLGARVVSMLAELGARGASRGELARLGAVLAVLAAVEAVLALGLRAPARLRSNLALGAAAGVAGLYLCEALLVLGAPEWRERRAKLRRIESLRAAGIDAYPGVAPIHFMRARAAAFEGAESVLVDGVPTLPLSGIAHRRTVACREAGDWLEYDSDEHGFHNPPGSWQAPVHLAFLGDSFVHGNCVPSQLNLVGWARRRVPATLNLGMAGSGPLAMLAALREYLPRVRPRTVVWCHFGGNDLLDLRAESEHPILRRYLEPGFTQDLDRRRAATDGALRGYTERSAMPALEHGAAPRVAWARAARLGALRSRLGLAFADPYGLAASEDEYRLFARVLAEARRATEGWGGRLVFAYLPAWPATPRQLGEAEYARAKAAMGERARGVVASLGIPLVDVERRFEAEPDPRALYACPGCHYSASGYELAARTILDALPGAAR
jgi:hypothetical protein